MGRRGDGEMYPKFIFFTRAVREVGGNQKRSTKYHEIALTKKYRNITNKEIPETALTKNFVFVRVISWIVSFS